MDSNSNIKREQDSISSKSKIYEALMPLIKQFKEDYDLSKEDLVNMYEDAEKIKVPLRIFSRKLSPLEALFMYLKKNQGFRFHDIALELNRDDRSIWKTYQQAKSKSKSSFESRKNELIIPIAIFKNRNLSILENLFVYLKFELKISVKKISFLTNKNISTIWTVYSRSKKKVNSKGVNK